MADSPVDVEEAGAHDDGVDRVCTTAACTFDDAGQWQGGLTANSGGPVPRKVAAMLQMTR